MTALDVQYERDVATLEGRYRHARAALEARLAPGGSGGDGGGGGGGGGGGARPAAAPGLPRVQA